MKRDENENSNQIFSSEEISRSIFISKIPPTLNPKSVFVLFSKAGEIQSIYNHETCIIIIFTRQSSVEMALFYDHFKFGASEEEISVESLKSIEKNTQLIEKTPWKEVTLNKKDAKYEESRLNETPSIRSLRSSIVSQESLAEAFENVHSKLVRRVSTLMKKEEETENMPPLKLLQKYHDEDLYLPMIKEAGINSERNSPKSTRRRYSYNKENESSIQREFSLKLNKVFTFDDQRSPRSPVLEKKTSIEHQTHMRKNLSGSLRKSIFSIPEEQTLEDNEGTRQTEGQDAVLTNKTEENTERLENNYGGMDEDVEKIFQPLKNKVTVIGKYYKYEDLTRDYVFDLNYIGFMMKVWVVVYACYLVYQFLYEN